jgi:hypothetical protein
LIAFIEQGKYVFVQLMIFEFRNTVKYIAQTDLDEMFVLNVKNKTLVEFMDDLSNANPNMAAASFVSRRAKSPVS